MKSVLKLYINLFFANYATVVRPESTLNTNTHTQNMVKFLSLLYSTYITVSIPCWEHRHLQTHRKACLGRKRYIATLICISIDTSANNFTVWIMSNIICSEEKKSSTLVLFAKTANKIHNRHSFSPHNRKSPTHNQEQFT